MPLRNFKMFDWNCTIFDSLVLLLVVLPWTQSAVLRCDSTNRDPCARFPDLCSEGGGLCVVKGPCEYECVCPPDGRRGRDCSQNGAAPNQPKETDQTSGKGGSHVESLLVFPQNLFWDLNHVKEPFEFIKMTSSLRPFVVNIKSTPPTFVFESAKTTLQTTHDSSSQATTVNNHGPSSQATVTKISLSKREISSTDPQTIPPPTIVVPTRPSIILHASSSDFPPKLESLPSSTTAPFLDRSASKLKKISFSSDNRESQNTRSNRKGSTMLPSRSRLSTGSVSGRALVINNPKETSTSRFEKHIQETNLSSKNTNIANIKDPSNSPNGRMSSSSSPFHTDIISSRSRPFPGHEMFPTFFSEQREEFPPGSQEKPNAPLTFVVQRVYHRPETFPVFRRGNN